MVEVVEVVQSDGLGGVGGIFNSVFQVIYWFADNWVILLCGFLLMILGIVIFILWFGRNDALKERDEPGYLVFKQVKSACRRNQKNQPPLRVQKSYSMLNLIWFGLPIIFNERSTRILNSSHQLIGYWRGEYLGQDGFKNIMYYTSKILWFEKERVLKLPILIKFNKNITQTAGESPEGDITKDKIVKKTYQISLKDVYQMLPNGDILLSGLHTEPIGYYYDMLNIPLVRKDGVTELFDTRKLIEGAISENIFEIMHSRRINQDAVLMDRMGELNPQVKFRQKVPEKTGEEIQYDQEVQE